MASARQLAQTVAPGIVTLATRKSTKRDKPFPSAKHVSTSETTEAIDDPCAPLVRLSAPTPRSLRVVQMILVAFASPRAEAREDDSGLMERSEKPGRDPIFGEGISPA